MTRHNTFAAAPASDVLEITWSALRVIIDTVGSRAAESGALLCGAEGSTRVSQAHFDTGSRNTGGTFSPDTATLNALMKTLNGEGIRLQGFVHSHPSGFLRPSGGDALYAARILDAIPDLPFMWMPIVQAEPDNGHFSLRAFAAHRARADRADVRECRIAVLDLPHSDPLCVAGVNVVEALRNSLADGPLAVLSVGTERGLAPPVYGPRPQRNVKPKAPVTLSMPARTDEAPALGQTFDRVQGAYDLPLLMNSRIIAVGMGGAAAWAEDCARAGIGQWVLIDPDTVSETNLATQQVYRRDIGRPKVDCVAERLRDIHPTAQVKALQQSLDELSDAQVERLATEPWNGAAPVRTVICGLTDNFQAQARVNRLALKLGLPSLSAQVYREGRGAEVTFTFPGVTPACQRCILSSRYRHYLDNGQGNDVTSHGTPIFATTRLNALKGFLLLALLHHGSSHPRWGPLLQRIGKRNLVQLSLDPDIATTMGLGVFAQASHGDPRRLFDDTVWLAQDAEAPPTYATCPDCGGTGDLRDCTGRIADTLSTPLNSWASGTVALVA